MLDVDLTVGNSTIIKFGGYDTSQMTSDGYYTYDTSLNWEIKTEHIYWGSYQFNSAGRNVQFTPDYPFMYAGSNDFLDLIGKL